MRRLVVLAVMMGVFAVMAPANAGASAARAHSLGGFRLAKAGPGVRAGAKSLHVRENWRPAATRASTRAVTFTGGIKTFTRSINDGGTVFPYTMVGQDPFVAQSSPTTNVTTWLLVITINNSGGHTFDPTAVDPCDTAGVSAMNRTIASPIFKKKQYTWGHTSIGGGAPLQYVDAFQRANFWSQTQPTGINPNYHVNVKIGAGYSHVATATLNVSGYPEYTGGCEPLLELDINAWDTWVQNSLLPSAASQLGAGPKTFPLILVHNVVFTENGGSVCCVLGYHNYIPSTPAQTYGVADYDNTGAFGASVSDVSAMSHEVGEWMNDPTGGNPTKPWGHIGQVSGCQNNLEVGDPLSGTVFNDPKGGFTYHVQELAFFSWFYHQSPSIGVNGWYSNKGTFTSAALPCS